ncbi:N-acetylglucosamine kinase [Mangrovicella endophytica]|uniref:N-acetylglucosamine kinase n=1 Tax=Mangrovicella endophytica TaxID=2066697 RepID=UPI000C9DDE77|nr:BadF/BadG/BcrA/BcrD ATPase family protein [Mangrovicella endophytica]
MTASGPVFPARIVGIDIGGTKTHLRLEGPEGRRDRVLPSQDWRKRDWAFDATALIGLVTELAAGDPVAAIAVGAHGCDDGAECEAFEAAFLPVSACPVQVVNDAELMPAALGLEHAIGLVAGTGSIAVCRDSAGQMHVAGGWGWIIGDEGSAASLVREAARAVAHHLDRGGSEDDPLARRLFAALEIPSPARIGSRLAQIGSAAALGAHARLVFEAEREGSALAAKVVEDGGRALADLVASLEARGVRADTVVAGGSVIVAQPSLWKAFSRGLEAACQGRVAARLFAGAPVEGACFLARRRAALGLAGHKAPAAFIDMAAKANG